MFQIKAKLIKNIAVGQKYYKMVLSCSPIAKTAKPGQFLQIRVSERCEPLLRRPLSIHRVNATNTEVLYEVVGEGSQILSQKKSGGYLDIIGPLGNGFDYKTAAYGLRTAVLVAGGMGVAPLIFLAEKLAEIKNQKIPACRQAGKIKILVLVGAKNKKQLLCEKEFKQLGCAIKVATDDGSRGFKGRVTDLLKEVLRNNETTKQRDNEIYGCGPRPMLKEIGLLAKKYHIPAQISLEEHMACGIGACLGCVVNTKDGYKRVCKEGPVFNADKIIWQGG